MLVLSRGVDQKTRLHLEDGRVITIMVTSIQPNRVKIGISAPDSVRIVRAEAGNQQPKQFDKVPRNPLAFQSQNAYNSNSGAEVV